MMKAIVFPGQGAQYAGMGKDLYLEFPKVKEIYDKADQIFNDYYKGSEFTITSLSFGDDEATLQNTAYTQPAILTLSIAVAEILKAKNLLNLDSVKFTAGHSLGEFSALYFSEVLSFEDCLKLVIKRGDLMSKAPKGAMSAVVGLSESDLINVIKEFSNVSVANFNSPDQIVITGSENEVLAANQALEAYGIAKELKLRVIPLSVGGAFHSPLMKEASVEFSKLIDSVKFNTPSLPIIQNISAEAVNDLEQIKANLKLQMTGSVKWTQTVQKLTNPENQISEILELGPGKVLNGLIKKQDRRFPVKSIQSVADITALNPELLEA
jgi:[acyl-carrier-protein] S-malonyltransferase